MTTQKVCGNCKKFPCIRDSVLRPSDHCQWVEDFEYKDNLVIKQKIALLLETRLDKQEERYFNLYLTKKEPLCWWLDNDEGITIISEKNLKRDWHKSSAQIGELVRCVSSVMIEKLNPNYYENIDARLIRQIAQSNIIELANKVSNHLVTSANSDNEKNNENITELRTPKTLPNGNLVEVVYNPEEDKAQLLVWDGANANVVSEIKMAPIIYKPPSDTEYFRKGVVLLPSGIEEYGSVNQLVDELKAFMHKYMDVPEREYDMCAYYVLFSYLQDVFNAAPFLRALGDSGCGKSRLLDVVGMLCYRATVISGAVTSAPIYRLAENWKGTLVIHEADFKESDLYNEIIKILNCRYEKGRPVIRCRKDQPDKIDMFDTYGLTVLATRREFRDVALESRCYTIVMQVTDRKDLPKNLPKEFFEEQAKLRNKLLLFRLRNHKKEVELKEDGLEDLEPRIIQIMLPLLSIIEDKDAKERLLDLIREYQKRLIGERQDTVEGQIVLAIDMLLHEFPEDAEITPKLIAEKMVENGWETTPSTIGRKLKALGFKSLRKPGGDRKRIIVMDKRVWAKCKRRYIGIDEKNDVEESAPTTKPILSNTGWDRWDTKDSNIGNTLEKTPEAQPPNEKEVEGVNELGAWMTNHYKNHKGIPKEFFVRDVLKAFPSAEPAEIEKFYEVLGKYQQEGVL